MSPAWPRPQKNPCPFGAASRDRQVRSFGFLIDKNGAVGYGLHMAKAGRPRLSKALQRKVRLAVRVTTTEKRVLDGAAKTAGVRLSTWARATLLAAAGASR